MQAGSPVAICEQALEAVQGKTTHVQGELFLAAICRAGRLVPAFWLTLRQSLRSQSIGTGWPDSEEQHRPMSYRHHRHGMNPCICRSVVLVGIDGGLQALLACCTCT